MFTQIWVWKQTETDIWKKTKNKNKTKAAKKKKDPFVCDFRCQGRSRTGCPLAHCEPFHSVWPLLFFCISARRLRYEEASMSAAANSGILVVCCALSMLSRAQRLLGLSPSWCWALCSHELWLLHRLLVCGWIPWGVAGNVRSGRAHWSLHGGRRAPDRCHRGRTTGKSTAGGQSVAVDRTTALLHQLLEFGSFILKPNFYLQIFFFKRDIKIYVNIYITILRGFTHVKKWKAKHDNKKYKLSLLINNTK